MPQALPMLAYYAAGQGAWGAFAAFVVSVAVTDYQKTQAKEKARAAAAAAARDRTITIRSGVAPRRIVLGTVRLGGVLMHAEFVGDDQEFLDQVYALTHGEISEFVGLFLDDEFVAVADIVDGVPTTGKFSGAAVIAERLVHVETIPAESPTDTITLPHVPSDPADVQAILDNGGVGESSSQVPLTISSVVGAVVTLSEPVSGAVHVHYSSQANPRVPLRVQGFMGTESQATTTWAGVSTPAWTADHRLRGVSGFRTLSRLDSNVYAQGLPNPSAVLRGPKGVNGHLVWDPRSSTYVTYTSNPALLAAWFRTLPRREGGCGVPFDWIDWPSVSAAANICDELLSVKKLDGSGYENVKRYECHTVLNLDEQSPAENLQIILDAMAGDFPFTAGKYYCYAGAFRAATITLTDDDIAGDEPVTFAPMVGADQTPPNVMTGRIYSAAHNWVQTGAPAVENTSYVTADGEEEQLELDLVATTDLRQANYLMGVRLEQMRPGLAGTLTVLGRGADIMLMETVQIDAQGYEALAGITFEIRKRTNHWNGHYSLDLREVRSTTYALDADRFTPPTDVTPPDASELWNVTAVDITTVANAAITASNGSVVCRALVTWAAHPQRAVNPMGKIEVRYAAPGAEWTYVNPVDGDRTNTYISPLREGEVLFIEARARNVVGAVSAWTGYPPFTVVATNEVPQDVEGEGWEIKPGQVLVYWDRWVGDMPLEIELRVGATWAGGTLLWSGVGTDYKHARPPNGTYTVWLAYRRGNVYSATPKSLTIVVDDSIDAGLGGSVEITYDRFPYFAFADGTTHTSSSPVLTMTAQLVGLGGTVTWTAKAYNVGGTYLGDITLGGSGNVATMTGAAFAAPGSSGSVRYAVVRATHPSGVYDEIQAHRQDPTITTPRLYLTNRVAAVATDENGEGGDYSGANTDVAVYVGIVNEIDDWSTAITPDAGVTATINGGAGPVTGTLSVNVAVSAMTIASGAVEVRASKSGETDLVDFFHIEKNEGSGAYNVYWDPLAEIVLPLGADGQVSSYAGAASSLQIDRALGVSDVANWTFSLDLQQNVVATLTGNLVTITGVVALGTVSASSSDDITLPSGWTRPQSLTWGPLGWVAFGYHATTGYQYCQTSPDFVSWTTRDMGTVGRWEFGAADDISTVIAVEFSTASTDKVLRSTDGGLTWGALGSLGASSQWYSVQWMGDKFIVCAQSSTAGRQSADRGATWSALSMPGNGCIVFGGPGRYLASSTSGEFYLSKNGGTTWGSAIAALSGLNIYKGFLYKGRLVLIPLSGSTVRYSDDPDAVVWAQATLPHSVVSGPRFADVVSGVLYVVASDGKVMFTTDGRIWRYAGGTTATGQQHLGRGGYYDIQAALLPNIYSTAGNKYVRTPLLATSETEGGVRVRAVKPAEADIVRFLPVRRGAVQGGGYAFSASPQVLALPATSDGVVTDFSAASITAMAQKDGADYTAQWTWAWTAVNMTPSSGSTNVATFTAMSSAQNTGSVSFSATKAGEGTVTGTLQIIKIKGPESSGPRVGAIYSVTEGSTLVGVRFNTDGSVDVRRGSGGSYTRYTQWSGAVVAGAGTGKYLRARLRAGGHALSMGALDTWQELSTARTYELSDSASGIHSSPIDWDIGTSSVGANMVTGFGELRLEVP